MKPLLETRTTRGYGVLLGCTRLMVLACADAAYVFGATCADNDHDETAPPAVMVEWHRDLSSPTIPLKERAAHMRATVRSSFLWGSQLWTPSRTLNDFVEAAEIRWLRRMTHDARLMEEDWILYHRRRRARVLPAREQGGGLSAWEVLGGTIHGWWGTFSGTRKATPVRRRIGGVPDGGGRQCRPARLWMRDTNLAQTGVGCAPLSTFSSNGSAMNPTTLPCIAPPGRRAEPRLLLGARCDSSPRRCGGRRRCRRHRPPGPGDSAAVRRRRQRAQQLSSIQVSGAPTRKAQLGNDSADRGPRRHEPRRTASSAGPINDKLCGRRSRCSTSVAASHPQVLEAFSIVRPWLRSPGQR